jgi:hypothetical protein
MAALEASVAKAQAARAEEGASGRTRKKKTA